MADDMIGFVQQFRPRPLIALVLAFLLTAAGCGSFFPGSHDIASIQVAPQNATVAPGVNPPAIVAVSWTVLPTVALVATVQIIGSAWLTDEVSPESPQAEVAVALLASPE